MYPAELWLPVSTVALTVLYTNVDVARALIGYSIFNRFRKALLKVSMEQNPEQLRKVLDQQTTPRFPQGSLLGAGENPLKLSGEHYPPLPFTPPAII